LSLLGIHLTLLMGPEIAVPAPLDLAEALKSVSVTNNDTGKSGFSLTFEVGRTSPLDMLDYALLLNPLLRPFTRVVLVVTFGVLPQVLCDGVITNIQLQPSNEPGASTLTVTGEDVSVMMDMKELPFPWPALPADKIVTLILAKYAQYALAPVVFPAIFPNPPSPTERVPVQTMTDLSYINFLAARQGYVFYVEPGPAPLTSIAYFGPDVRIPIPQPALNVNMDAHTNVESLSFTLNGLEKKIVIIRIFDPVTEKQTLEIPVPDLSVLRPPLGARLTPPARVELDDHFAKLSPNEAAQMALGVMWNSNDAVTASGSLDVLRYGRILRSRLLVGVRGAGLTYDGMYYVNSVTHSIKRGEYKQSFSLSRDGLISTTPIVPTISPLP